MLSPSPHLSRVNTIALFVCMSEMLMEKEMAVMLNKIFILLAGQPSETSSHLAADMATEKEKKKDGQRERGWGVRVHTLLKCQDVINSYKVNTEDFNLRPCRDKDFSLLCSRTRCPAFCLSPSVTFLHILTTGAAPLCVTLSWFCS